MKESIIQFLSSSVTGGNIAAFNLGVTLFLAYALSIFYRLKIRNLPPTAQHYYFISTGLALTYFNYGWDLYHSVIGVIVGYLICLFLGGTVISIVVTFVFYMGYIFVGFYYTATDTYDLLWTLPQCIITLRMIALVTDLYDGKTIKPEDMDENTKETALTECPPLLEIAAMTYFYSSFLVGPQFALKRFRDFVNGCYEPPTITEKEDSQRVKVSVGRLGLGILYMTLHFFMYSYFPTEYYTSDDFKSRCLIVKCLFMMIWLRAIMFRYQAVWLIAESSCILSGLAYNGRNKDGVVLWDAVRNIRMVKFEFGCSFQSVIESFNYNTNLWAGKYIFKRLRFLGNKNLSHLLTLLFLSLWHGFYSGYLICFAYEFACVICERQSSIYFGKTKKFQTLSRSPEFLFPIWAIKKSIVLFGCSYGFLPFIQLVYHRWIQVQATVYFLGWIGIAVTLLIDKMIWRKRKNLGILDLLI